MSIVDPVADLKNVLLFAFLDGQARGKVPRHHTFRPVARLVDDKTNLYEMFCLTRGGRRVRGIAGQEFRPIVTGRAKFTLVQWNKKLRRYVRAR
jgi:hypothetical protein